MPAPSPSNSKLSIAAALVALLAGGVFLVALMQTQSGRYFSKTVPLDRLLSKAEPAGEFGFRVSLPKANRDDPRVIEEAVVLEDGEPLPLRIEKIKHVGEKGRGRYRLTQRTVYLSTPDNSDPRSNGRRYELEAPRTLRPVVLWLPLVLLVAAMFVMLRFRASNLPPWRLRPWVEPALVLAISFGVMFWSLNHFSDHSDGWLIVKGKPYSDGMGWVELGKSLSEGRGFSGAFEAHRGGYPILLGGFFSLVGGGSVIAAKLFNVLMLGIGATAVYLFARAAFGRGVGVLALLGLLLGTRFEVLAQMTLTEPTGFALAAVGLQQFHRACLNPTVWRFFVVGVFLGLSNLIRPFTLLALPVFGALILCIAWRQRWGLKRFATIGVAYVGGAMLIFGPWVMRQKLTWGHATLDLNSAVMIYGAAAPPEKEGQKQMLGARHYIEGDEAGFARHEHGKRYEFYMGRYREVVSADMGGYLGFVAGKFVEFFDLPGFGDGQARERLSAVFFFALVWLAWRRKFPPLVLLAGLWPFLADTLAGMPALLVILIASTLGFVFYRGSARWAIAILLVTLLAAAVLNALVGNFALNRGIVFVEWIEFLLVSAGFCGLARCAAGRSNAETETDAHPRFADGYALVVLALFAVASIFLLGKVVLAEKPDPDGWGVSDVIAESARARVGVRASERDDLYVARVRLGEYRWFVRAGEDLGHWARPFEVRGFDRTIAMPQTGYDRDSFQTRRITVNLPGNQFEIDGERDYILVGLRNVDEHAELNHGSLIIETLALFPYSEERGELSLEEAIHFNPPGELQGGR